MSLMIETLYCVAEMISQEPFSGCHYFGVSVRATILVILCKHKDYVAYKIANHYPGVFIPLFSDFSPAKQY